MVGGRALDRNSTMHGAYEYDPDLKRKRGFLESLEMGVIKIIRECDIGRKRGRERRERKRKVTLSGKG